MQKVNKTVFSVRGCDNFQRLYAKLNPPAKSNGAKKKKIMYAIKVTPASTFAPHILHELGLFEDKNKANHYAKETRKCRNLYDSRKKFYSKVEVVKLSFI